MKMSRRYPTGGGKRQANGDEQLQAKQGRSAGAIMSGGGERCNGGTGYKVKSRGRAGGSLVGGGGKKGKGAY